MGGFTREAQHNDVIGAVASRLKSATDCQPCAHYLMVRTRYGRRVCNSIFGALSQLVE